MKKGTLLLVFILFFVITQIKAQETTTTAGGEATGSGGSSSYSIGQVVYTTNSGSNASVAQGVQQAYEISTTAGITELGINLALRVYPNPTTNFLTLKVTKTEALTFVLFDIQGKLIKSKTINDTTTNINLEDQASATYFLHVMKNNKPIKTFKIIKK